MDYFKLNRCPLTCSECVMNGLCESLDLRVIEIVNDWQVDKDSDFYEWRLTFIGNIRKPMHFSTYRGAIEYIKHVPVKNRGYLVRLDALTKSHKVLTTYTWYPEELPHA